MFKFMVSFGVLVILWVGFPSVISAQQPCPRDSVQSGPICIDKYEASVWKTTEPRLVKLIRAGTASYDDLISLGAIQLGISDTDLIAAGCSVGGAGCIDIYAASIPNVTPAARISWFQALAASRNSGKRLPTNAEWQAAALGTADGPPCRIGSAPGGPLITWYAGVCV